MNGERTARLSCSKAARARISTPVRVHQGNFGTGSSYAFSRASINSLLYRRGRSPCDYGSFNLAARRRNTASGRWSDRRRCAGRIRGPCFQRHPIRRSACWWTALEGAAVGASMGRHPNRAEWGPRCVQSNRLGDIDPLNKRMDEDCLYLNVWTPTQSPSEALPVMVWIHGGSNLNGAGSQPEYDASHLANKAYWWSRPSIIGSTSLDFWRIRN